MTYKNKIITINTDMNIKTKSKLRAAMREENATLEEATPFSIPVEITRNHVMIKLPRKALKYLKMDKNSKLSAIPINNILHLTTGKALTLIPAFDMNSCDELFKEQAV